MHGWLRWLAVLFAQLVVERLLLVPLFGYNVAWCYADYSDELFDGCVRLGHAPAWWLLGAICLHVYPLVTQVSMELASQLSSSPSHAPAAAPGPLTFAIEFAVCVAILFQMAALLLLDHRRQWWPNTLIVR